MDIIVKFGYKEVYIKDVSVPIVEKLMSSAVVDSSYTDGEYHYFKSSDSIKIEVIKSDLYHPMTKSEHLAMQQEIENGYQDPV